MVSIVAVPVGWFGISVQSDVLSVPLSKSSHSASELQPVPGAPPLPVLGASVPASGARPPVPVTPPDPLLLPPVPVVPPEPLLLPPLPVASPPVPPAPCDCVVVLLQAAVQRQAARETRRSESRLLEGRAGT
jgi:hypothetical protein